MMNEKDIVEVLKANEKIADFEIKSLVNCSLS